jgi:3-oxoacyl-[acyl-carrier-protein] synthase III
MTSENPAINRPRCRSLMGVQILATGSYVPDKVVTNSVLQEQMPECDPEWLVRQTGIRERRHAAPDQATSDLCVESARRCLEAARIDPSRVDLLILATVTPDMSFPATACIVQNALGLNCPAFDLSAGCSGFIYGLVMACSAVRAGTSDLALVVAGDCMSRIINPHDHKTYPLLGDGSGAVLVAAGRPDQGLVSYCMGADGAGGDLLYRKACGSRFPPTPELLEAGAHYLVMDGRGVFTWAVTVLSDTITAVLADAGLNPLDVDLYIPHQANQRIINAALDVLHIPRSRVITNLERYGNTSAASAAIALDETCCAGRIAPGSRLILSGYGAGLSWGTALWKW